MSATQQLLDVLRDARDQGLWQEQAAIVEELAADIDYVAHTYSSVSHPVGRVRSALLAKEWLGPVDVSRRLVDMRLQRQRYLGTLIVQRIPSSRTAEPMYLRLDWSER